MSSKSASVHVIRPASLSPERVAACLIQEEKTRASRFKFAKDAVQWSACRAALREILGQALGMPAAEVPLVLSATGKPGLPPPHGGLHFNLSHCDGLALVGLSENGPLGIDLEPLDRANSLLKCETSFCHPDEIRMLPVNPEERARQLLRIWTAKEAVLKALGTGLTHPPERVTIHFDKTSASDPSLEEIGKFRFHPLSHPSLEEFQAMLALSTGDQAFEMHDPG